MIHDRLEQAERYLPLHRGFAAAIAFLRNPHLGETPSGRIEIAEGVYATVARPPMRPRNEALLEAHRHYIDIQYVITGVEEMGWSALSRCRQPHSLYDAAKDVEFFSDAPDSFMTVRAGEFVIFLPDDAHAPLIGSGEAHKVVVKVPV